MSCEQHDFTRKFTMNIRPVDGLGALAGVLLILSPMLNPTIPVGLGVALLFWVGFCQLKLKRHRR